MLIKEIETWVEHFELKRPYAIAFKEVEAVDIVVVRIQSGSGLSGLGTASPEPLVTGETLKLCCDALKPDSLSYLEGLDPRRLPCLGRMLNERMKATPAACAAVDIALHGLVAKTLSCPVVDMLGRCHKTLPTSITVGIKPAKETVEEAAEYVGRGFTILKIKGGRSLEEDIERLHKLREELGFELSLRVDPNQGYTVEEVRKFIETTRNLEIEFLEQPVKVEEFDKLRSFPEETRSLIAADESILDYKDAFRLLSPPPACGILNIKLMKCGGIHSAMRIATIAEAAGARLMWGCMDESIVSISAALHAAFASPATAYLDLDGSFDLAYDIVDEGFTVENGYMQTRPDAGFGVTTF